MAAHVQTAMHALATDTGVFSYNGLQRSCNAGSPSAGRMHTHAIVTWAPELSFGRIISRVD